MATRGTKATKITASDIFITEGDRHGNHKLCWASNSTILGVIQRATDGAGWIIKWVRRDEPSRDDGRVYVAPQHPDKFYNSATEACMNVAKQSGVIS